MEENWNNIIFNIFFDADKKISAQTTNAGFVPENIWYSKDPFAEGDKIKIYTLIFNPDTRKFSGTVDFFDNSTLLGTKDFNVAGTSTEDIYISWTVTAGNHQIYGEIQNAKFLTANGTYVTASITDNKTSTSSRTVTNKIISQEINNGVNTLGQSYNNAVNSIQNIGNTAKNALPQSISQTVSAATDTLDGWRANIGVSLGQAKAKTQTAINKLDQNEASTIKMNNVNDVTQKPFEYVALFFFTALSYIFQYKILFYGILIIIVFFIIRYFWHLFL